MLEPQISTALLDPKKLQELQTVVPKMLAQAHDLDIADNDDYITAGTFLDIITERKATVSALFEKPTKEAASVHKFLTTLRANLLAPLEQAETLMKSRRFTFREEAARKTKELEEAKRKAAKKEEDDRALQEAARFEEMGESEAANTVLERAAAAPPPAVYVPSTIPKEQGHSYRTVHKYRVVNSSLIKREFLIEDESKIQAIVGRLGLDAASIVGGIEIYTEEIEVVRRKS